MADTFESKAWSCKHGALLGAGIVCAECVLERAEHPHGVAPDANPKTAFGLKKPPLHLVPEPALIEVAMVMGLGAKKYGAFNWRETEVAASVYVSAARRHLASWFDGESTDEESRASHLAHVAACMFIILDAAAVGTLIDDRPPPGAAARLIRELTAK